jgi:hypothetical protein
MSGPSVLVFGTKKSITSSLAKKVTSFLEKNKHKIFATENPKDSASRWPFDFAVFICEEKVPPPTLDVWLKAFAEDQKPSERLFVLAKEDLPPAWQERLPIESFFDESNFEAVLKEIMDPGEHSQKGAGTGIADIAAAGISIEGEDAANGELSLASEGASPGGMFDIESDGGPVAQSESNPDEGLFANGDLSENLSLDAEPPKAKAVTGKLPPPPAKMGTGLSLPSAKPTGLSAPPAKPSLPGKVPVMKLGIASQSPPRSSDAATKMMPLPNLKGPPKKLPASLSLDDDSSLDEASGRAEPSVEFDLSENTSALDNRVIEDEVSPEATGFGVESPNNQATRLSKPLNPDDLPSANDRLRLPTAQYSESEPESKQTGSIRLEALEHPDGTRLNEPLAGRGGDVSLDDIAKEAQKAAEDIDFSADPEPEDEPPAPEMPEPTFEVRGGTSGSSKSEVKTLEKYLAIKDRELRERESNIKILKGQIQKTEAKLLKSDEARRTQALKLDETQAEIRALREELEQKNFALQKVEDHHREEMKALQARMDGALFEANKSGKRLDEFRERVKQDIQKIRAQERELANKLEIQKRDADALLSAKDEKLMAQKREIDQLQFELDNMKERLVEETEKAEERSKRLARALSSLKLAQGMLSGIKEEVVPSAEASDDGDEGEAA